MGRHSHPDDLLDSRGDVDQASAAAAGAEGGTGGTAAGEPKKTSAVADLQLVLHNPRLLTVCLIAVAVPFAVYFMVIIALHKMADWPLFIGAPMVLAGVLVGAVLDYAYGQLRGARAATAPASAEPEGPGSRSSASADLS